MNRFLLILSLLSVFLFSVSIAHANDLPTYSNYVNDYTHTLSPGTVSTLNKELSQLEKQTTDQVAVAIVDSTNGKPIEQYSIDLARKWGIGHKYDAQQAAKNQASVDNGILFIIAKNDHKDRIEVGTGLEGKLTDVQVQDILNSKVNPAFKQGDFNGGVIQGTEAIVTALGGSISISGVPATTSSNTADSSGTGVTVVIILAVILFIVLIVGSTLGDGDGFLSGALTGGAIGSLLSSGISDDDGGFSGSSSDGDSFGGFSGGGFSGGGASGGW